MKFPGIDGEMYRFLYEHGTWLTKRDHVTQEERGELKQCAHNSVYRCALPLWCGFGINSRVMLPIGHCWNICDGDIVYDTTWEHDSDDYYFGIPFSKEIAHEILTIAAHGNEVIDCWRSAARKADEATVTRWRCAILEHVSNNS